MYPGTIFNYNKFVTMEMRSPGSTYDWSLGANLPFSEKILGVYLNEPTGIDVNSIPGFDEAELNISRKIDLFLGLSDGLAVGLGLSAASHSNNKDVETQSATYLDLKAGKSTDMLDLGIIIKLPMGSIEHKNPTIKTTFFTLGVDLNGRYYFIQKEDWSLSGIAEFEYMGNTSKYKPSGGTEQKATTSEISLHLGLGINYNVTETTLLALGIKPLALDLVTTKYTPGTFKTTSNNFIIPEVKIGIESWVKPWLVLRAGATDSYYYDSFKTPEDDKADVESYDYVYYYSAQVGVGFKFNNFTIDSLIRNQLLFDGPNFIGGSNTGVSSTLSLGYTF